MFFSFFCGIARAKPNFRLRKFNSNFLLLVFLSHKTKETYLKSPQNEAEMRV